MSILKDIEYWKRGRDFLGVEYPVISGAMTWISDSRLVTAVSDAGGFGVLAAGNMPVDLFEREIKVLKAKNVNYFPDIPIFVAGGIATGKMMAHLFLMGASGVQMGTIFAMAEESPAHQEFKNRFKKARAREAFATPQYDSSLPVVAVRALKNKGTQEFGQLQLELLQKMKEEKLTRVEAQYEVEKFWIGALRKAVQEGDVDSGSLMAGQSVGLIDQIKPVRQIIQDMVREAEIEAEKVKRMLT